MLMSCSEKGPQTVTNVPSGNDFTFRYERVMIANRNKVDYALKLRKGITKAAVK
jgi:hypothetical protein